VNLSNIGDSESLRWEETIKPIANYCSQPSFQSAVHGKISPIFRVFNPHVAAMLKTERIRGVTHLVPELLESIPILFYAGQW
jgi:hypothetical protein